MNFLYADVPDPTDFPPQATAPGLRALDGSFRCDICGDLYDAPVTIACGHCFCSSCIRSSLSNKQECPSCRKSTGEGHIRPNPALESVISAWKEARPFVLGLVIRERERVSTGRQADKGTAKKRKRSVEPTSSTDRLENSVAGPSGYLLSPNGVEPTTPKPLSRAKKFKPKSVDAIIVPSSDAEEDEITPIGGTNLAPKPDDLVACPLCHKKVRYKKLNTHIDNNCKDSTASADTAATSWSKIMNGGSKNKGKHKKKESDSDDEYPLPISTYATLKDRQLKEMLAEQNLPLTGDRAVWEQRHQRWVVVYNSNLDKSLPNRKTKGELKRDLKKWEEDMTKKKKTVIKDTIGYQVEHKAEFDRLVKQARKTKEMRSSKPKEDSYSSSQSVPLPHSTSTEPIVVDSEEERNGQL